MFTVDEYRAAQPRIRYISALLQRVCQKAYFELTLEEAFLLDAVLLADNRVLETKLLTVEERSSTPTLLDIEL